MKAEKNIWGIDLVSVHKAYLSLSGSTGQSTLRQAQGDNCHGELVEPWIPRSSWGMTDYLYLNLNRK